MVPATASLASEPTSPDQMGLQATKAASKAKKKKTPKPKAVKSLKAASKAAGKAKVIWKASKVKGLKKQTYTVRYSYHKNMKKSKTKTVKKKGVVLSKLKQGKKVYIQVRTNAKYGKKTLHSAWSAKKAVTVKKKKTSVKWTRYYGDSAYATMTSVVEAGWKKSKYAVVVTSDNYLDGLAASALAGKGKAPILYAHNNHLGQQTGNILKRLEPKRVFVIGDEDVIWGRVCDRIERYGAEVVRLSGETAADTAVAIAKRVKSKSKTCFVVSDEGYRQAMCAIPYAYSHKSNIFYSEHSGKSISKDTLRMIKKGHYENVVLIGSRNAVSSTVANKIKRVTTGSVKRICGKTVYDTYVKFAKWAVKHGASKKYVGFTTLGDYRDGIVGGAVTGLKNGVLLAADGGNVSKAKAYVKKTRASMRRGLIFGDGDAVPSDVARTLRRTTKSIRVYLEKADEVQDTIGDGMCITRRSVLEALEPHQDDSYYLGTWFSSNSTSEWNNIWPYGNPRSDGYVGMNCAGWVARALMDAGADMDGLRSCSWTDPSRGVSGAASWRDYAWRNGYVAYHYNYLRDLFDSGDAERGDVILRYPAAGLGSGMDTHLMIYWGTEVGENLVWHQLPNGNHIEDHYADGSGWDWYLLKID